MAFSAEISRQNPSCFLFIIDQSGSMLDNFNNPPKPKAQGVSDAINNLLQNLVIKCYVGGDDKPRDYYYVGILGYGQNVGSAFSGQLSSSNLNPISDIALNPARIEERTKKIDDGAGGLVDQKVKFPIWLDPVSQGGTPMTQAFQKANEIIETWLNQHPDCFPPTIIHVTDGESTDGDPSSEMQKLISKSSTDGNVLLFNLHLSNNPNAREIVFPGNKELLPDKYSEMLYNSASTLTSFMIETARKEYNLKVAENSKGFVLNGSLVSVISALSIGTKPSNLR
jgi:hypothetical protein